MSKMLGAVIVLLAVFALFMLMPGLINSTDDLRTNDQTESFSVTTAVNATTANVVLSQDLWQNNTAYVSAIGSDGASDNPIANTYTAGTNTLNVSGLDDDATRNLTVTYSIAALDEYAGVEEASGVTPTLIYIALISVGVGVMYRAWTTR